ncbi:MAG TPA: MFS transporter [Tepidisphaeraceae bacterium]
MKESTSTIEPAFPWRVWPVYTGQALASFGTAFLQMGFFFYSTNRWGWSPRKNLALAAVEGIVYIFGALLSSTIAIRFGRRALGSVMPILFALIGVICASFADRPEVVAPLLVLLGFLVATYWPGMESLVATGTDAHRMARRLAVYNLVWPAVNALATAVCGVVIAHLPIGFFYISAAINGLGGIVLALGGKQPEESRDKGRGKEENGGEKHAHGAAEPELLRQRTLALWLSRIALPSTYLVSYALAALMPTLPSLAHETVSVQTVIGSLWLVGRWIAFSILAISTFWHTRPRLLIWASLVMLISFVLICVPTSVVAGGSQQMDLWVMGVAQIVLGWALALIYSGSLYFGMVLSEGSTEHGGYHEALIGLGQALGPGVATVAQIIRPGSIYPAVIAVAVLLAISLVASEVAAVRVGKTE